MSLFTQMIQLQMQILLMLGIGFFLRKKEIVTVEMLETLVSSVLQRNLIKNAEVTITDKFFDKYFRGLDVLMVEVDNYDFDGTPLPPSFAVRLVYDTETLSKEFI